MPQAPTLQFLTCSCVCACAAFAYADNLAVSADFGLDSPTVIALLGIRCINAGPCCAQGPQYNSGADQRIIKMQDMPVDPLEPPKFRHKKARSCTAAIWRFALALGTEAVEAGSL